MHEPDRYLPLRATPANDAYPEVQGASSVNVAIIGAGYLGLHTACSLVDRGVNDIAIVDTHPIGESSSGRNAGFVFAGYAIDLMRRVERFGVPGARAFFLRKNDAINTVRHRMAQYAIDCQLVDHGILWVHGLKNSAAIRERQRLLKKYLGVNWDWLTGERLRQLIGSARYDDALHEANAFYLNPVRYCLGLARGLYHAGAQVYELTGIREVARAGVKWRIATERGSIESDHLVLATDQTFVGIGAPRDRSVHPFASYVLATQPLGARLVECLPTKAAVWDTRLTCDYFRADAGRLVWGGHMPVLDRNRNETVDRIQRDMWRVFPQLDGVALKYAWAGQVEYASHRMPIIDPGECGLWRAQAFGGHGAVPTVMIGDAIAAAIAEGDRRLLDEFRVLKTIHSFRPFSTVAACAAGLIKDMKRRVEEWF